MFTYLNKMSTGLTSCKMSKSYDLKANQKNRKYHKCSTKHKRPYRAVSIDKS